MLLSCNGGYSGKVKNQYFADVNDYRKYGLLRQLACSGLNVGVCWMLTVSDGRSDGRFTQYWWEGAKWRAFDSVLYDALVRCADHPNVRNVTSARAWHLIPGAVYYEAILSDSSEARSEYFAEAFQALVACDLLFFDPDNGLEVTSVPVGHKKSSKYLYWPEVEKAFSLGKSTLIYQHFPREKRDSYIERRVRELATHTPAATVVALTTPFVLFLLAVRVNHLRAAERAARAVVNCWPNQIGEVTRFAG